MDEIKKILPILWHYVDIKNCAINVYTDDESLIVNVKEKGKVKTFKHTDSDCLITNLQQYFQSQN